MSANPRANGGLVLRDLALPDFRDYAVKVERAGRDHERGDPGHGRLAAGRRHAPTRPRSASWVRTRRHPIGWARCSRPPTGCGRCPSSTTDDHLAHQRPGHGDPLRAHLPGLARGVPADRPARPVRLLRGVHPHHRLDVQPARQVAQDDPRDRLAAAHRVAQLPAHEPRLAPGPQRLQPPGPGLHRPRREQEGRGHPGVPAAGCEHPALGHGPLPAQPALRQRHRRGQAAGARLPDDGPGGAPLQPAASGMWDWASNDAGDPDVVMACAGDIPTLETLAAVDILRRELSRTCGCGSSTWWT